MAGDVVADVHHGHWTVDGAVQVLHDSECTVVARVALSSGGTVIRKQVRGPDHGQRLRHERAMLQRLVGLECVPQLVEDAVDGDAADQDAILLVDVGGVALASVLAAGPMDLVELLPLAVDLAEGIAAVHGRGVVHKDVNPATSSWRGCHAGRY